MNLDYFYKYGIFYNPASKHYNVGGNTSVQCDLCKKKSLPKSVGYNQFDLCIECYKKHRPKPVVQPVVQSEPAPNQLKSNDQFIPKKTGPDTLDDSNLFFRPKSRIDVNAIDFMSGDNTRLQPKHRDNNHDEVRGSILQLNDEDKNTFGGFTRNTYPDPDEEYLDQNNEKVDKNLFA